MDAKLKECDLVLKGGVASGVVYGSAIYEIAHSYRFRHVGGTSAGAIASAMAAAAEYRRQTEDTETGFEALAHRSEQLAENIKTLIQPYPQHRGLFNFCSHLIMSQRTTPIETGESASDRWADRLKRNNKSVPAIDSSTAADTEPHPAKAPGLRKKAVSMFKFIVDLGRAGFHAFGLSMTLSVIAALLISVLAVDISGLGSLFMFGVLALCLSVLIGGVVLAATVASKVKQLQHSGFGLCSGHKQHSNQQDALTDWLWHSIDQIAGIDSADIQDSGLYWPLTQADLNRKQVSLSTMTSDLNNKRPIRLPLRARQRYLFSEAEFLRLFPKPVVNYLKIAGSAQWNNDTEVLEALANRHGALPERSWDSYAQALAFDVAENGTTPADLFPLPVDELFPVLLTARMSLSFPLLFSTVDLYVLHDSAAEQQGNASMQAPGTLHKIQLSDGGLSSNFPIHLFDNPLSIRPTFGLTLTDGGRYSDKASTYSLFQFNSRQSPGAPINHLFGFATALFNVAKDWQDNLQSQLPGYAERILHIKLFEGEGGFNFDMQAETVDQLLRRGSKAAEALVLAFEERDGSHASRYEESRYRRALSYFASLEQALEKISKTYKESAETADLHEARSYLELLTEPNARSLNNSREWHTDVLMPVVEDLLRIGEGRGTASPEALIRNGDLPPMTSKLAIQDTAHDAPSASPGASETSIPSAPTSPQTKESNALYT